MDENGAIVRYSLEKLLTQPGYFQVPLCQRSYAWGEQQIEQLLEDLYSAFTNDRAGNYYLGTLVVMPRDVGVLEVVDGQQRLTTLTLLLRHLGLISECNLRFENRPDATSFLQAFFGKEQSCLQTPVAMAAACQCFKNYVFVRAGEDGGKKPYAKPLQEEDAFATFLKERVCLYQITLPSRSDVARYFEVMNNRGVQLADVDVVKSRLMKHVQDREAFRIRWERCADFTRPRKLVAENPQEAIPREHSEARMDFPNFLLIALSLYQGESGISLDERQLLKTFTPGHCGREDFAKGFLAHLEKVRDLFDTWFVRSDLDGQGNIQRWVIAPWREEEETKAEPEPDPATRKQLIALEAMLEVTYTSRRNRTWVKDALGFLLENEKATDRDLIGHLEAFVKKRVSADKEQSADNWLRRGTDTPHLLLNLLDYLFMSRGKGAYAFKHRSTVEHFMPRNQTYSKVWKGAPDDAVEYIGNLCLLNNSDNPSLSNHSPEEKVNAWGMKEQAPKQCEMYKTPQWTWEDCKAHHEKCEEALAAFLGEGDKTSNP